MKVRELLVPISVWRLSERREPCMADACLPGCWGREAASHEYVGMLQTLREFCPLVFGALQPWNPFLERGGGVGGLHI